MKRIVLVLLLFVATINIFAQTDRHGNPVFNSEQISEEKFKNFELTSSYYTISNNISDKGSSVYVSDAPTLKEHLKFSRDLPSYFFIIHRGTEVLFMIMPIQKNNGEKTEIEYNIVNPNNGKSISVPCGVWGEISEKRVDELEKSKVDTAAKIIEIGNGKLYVFDGIGYRIQPYDKLKAEVVDLAEQLLDGAQKPKDTEAYIKQETIGGELDFNKYLEEKDQPYFLIEKTLYSKKDCAIYLWGKKVKMLGIKSSKKAAKLWEEIYQRELTEPEKNALVNGFESKE